MNKGFMNEGVSVDVETPIADKIEAKPLKISDNSTFKELSKEYTFFTPAVLTIYGNLPFDVMSQFYLSNNIKSKPQVILTDEALFEGLDTKLTGSVFNHYLMAVENKIWKDLALYMGTIGITDKPSKSYLGTEVQKLPMPDYLALRKHTVIPSPIPIFDVYTIALDGNKVCLHFVTGKNPMDKIKLVRSAPRKKTVEYAKSIFDSMDQMGS